MCVPHLVCSLATKRVVVTPSVLSAYAWIFLGALVIGTVGVFAEGRWSSAGVRDCVSGKINYCKMNNHMFGS